MRCGALCAYARVWPWAIGGLTETSPATGDLQADWRPRCRATVRSALVRSCQSRLQVSALICPRVLCALRVLCLLASSELSTAPRAVAAMLPLWSVLSGEGCNSSDPGKATLPHPEGQDAAADDAASSGRGFRGNESQLALVAPLLCMLQSPLFSEDSWEAANVLYSLQSALSSVKRNSSAGGVAHEEACERADGRPAAAVLLAAQLQLSRKQGAAALLMRNNRRSPSVRATGTNRTRSHAGSVAGRSGVVRRLSTGLSSRKRTVTGVPGIFGHVSLGRKHRHRRSLSLGDGAEGARSLAEPGNMPPQPAAALLARLLLRAVHSLVQSSLSSHAVGRFAADGTFALQDMKTSAAYAEAALQSAVTEAWRFCAGRSSLQLLAVEVLPAWRRVLRGLQQQPPSAGTCTAQSAAGLLDTSALLAASRVCAAQCTYLALHSRICSDTVSGCNALRRQVCS